MSQNRKILFCCIAVSLLLCLTQIMGNSMLILCCLGVYMVLLGWSCVQHRTLLVLLYFLPWAPILKPSPTGYSFYTFGLVLTCCISILRNKLLFKKYTLLSGIVIMFLTLLSKLLEGYRLEASYIAFIMMILVLPSVKEEYRSQNYDFYGVNLFFSAGIIIATLCAMEFADFSNIAKYINVDSYRNIIRRSGFYGDPNYYAAQINAALGGTLLLILKEPNKKKFLVLTAIIGFLIYCGALSGSKSFAVVVAFEVAVWLFNIFRMRRRDGFKLMLIVTTVVLGIYILSSAVFRDLLEVFENRFSHSNDLNTLTTGRVELWLNYVVELFGSAKIMFLGKGFTNVKVGGEAAHNTLLQLFFQLGLTGAVFLIYWIVCFLQDGPSTQNEKIPGMLAVVIGVYLPWMAIDMLFFDDFFLLQWYLFVAYYTLQKDNVN